MKQIELRDEVFALVDDEDYESLKGYNWCLFRCKSQTDYVCRYVWNKSEKTKKRIFMHREILKHNLPHTDHIDGNGLNNQRFNLRPATMSQNLANSGLQKNNTSGMKGVYWREEMKKWVAYIRIRRIKKQLYLGAFPNKNDAANAYDKAAVREWGEFARTNLQLTNQLTTT